MGDLFEYQNIQELCQQMLAVLKDIQKHITQDTQITQEVVAEAEQAPVQEPAQPKYKKVMGNKRWTKADADALIAGVARGEDYETIGARLGRTRKAIKSQVCNMRAAGTWPAKLNGKA